MPEGGRRAWAVTSVVLVACLAGLAVAAAVAPGTPGESGAGPASYLLVFGLVLGDAVIAVLPGETTLNVASTMAAQGTMDLGWVIVAGAFGAVLGDSALYAIARYAGTKVRAQLDAALANSKVATAKELLGTSAPPLLVLGRYVPGMRFVVNASLGVARHPYVEFLRWSAVGGTVWSVYSCTIAYLVGTVLEDRPLASVAVSALASTVAIALVLLVVVRRVRRIRAGVTDDAARTAVR